MEHDFFSEFKFQTGWKKNDKIDLFGNEYDVVVKLSAYFEEDGITEEQKKAYIKYKNTEKTVWERLECLLTDFRENPVEEFIPTTLLIDRNGETAFLLDDENAPEEGIAACIFPEEKLVSQDEYL